MSSDQEPLSFVAIGDGSPADASERAEELVAKAVACRHEESLGASTRAPVSAKTQSNPR